MKRQPRKLFNSLYQDKYKPQENTVCFFRFQGVEDCACAFEGLEKGSAVFLDLSGMDVKEALRLKDFMRGICTPMNAQIHEICEDYVVYFPSGYHLQMFEN